MGAIGLNPIRLDRIGLDPIRINAIRLGVPGAASGFDRPYIDPEVLASLKAVCICYGKINDDPDRAIVKNLVDPDNPFIISNAAYKLNSGYGKYETELSDTRIWTQSRDVTSSPFSSSYNGLSGWIIFANTELTNSADMPSFKIQVKGLLEGQELIYRYYDSTGQTNVYSMTKDGEYTLPSDVRTAKPLISNTSGFQVVKNETNTITITQIPSYQGAFVTDGVDDLITSTKTVQEMLGGSNEITAISMIGYIDSTYDARINFAGRAFGNTFLNNRIKQASGKGKTYIVGYTKTKSTAIQTIDIPLGDKEECSSAIGEDSTINATFSVAGFIKENNTAEYNSVAWYWTVIANKVLTTDQINQVIAYYNLDRCVEPTVLYDVKRQGLSNDTPDSDWYLKDFSKNGFDMSLFNFAKKGNSGVGKYNFSSINPLSNRFEGTVTSNKCHFTKKLVSDTSNFCYLLVISPNEPIKFKVSGLSDGRKLFILNKSGSGSNYNFDNGEYEVSLSFSEGVGQNNPFGVTGDIGDIDVTVEFIPSHAGALCFDGVEDFGKVTGLPIYKDYTVVADREIETINGGVLSKSYVADNGSFIFEQYHLEQDSTSSFGYTKLPIDNLNRDRKISYQSKYSYNGTSLSVGTGIDGSNMWIATIRDNDSRFSNIAIYSLMSFPYSLSEFLIERQLKKHKLGTLYPDMVEWRPIYTSNVNDYKITKATYFDETGQHDLALGNHYPIGTRFRIYVKPSGAVDEVTSIKVNGVELTYDYIDSNYGYAFNGTLSSKSPQKIDITIYQPPQYLTMLSNSTLISNETLIKNE